MAQFRDSVGNTYAKCASGWKQNPGPKPSSGGDRKHGNKKRKPSAKRYLSERRWEKNKAKRRRP